jgi:hypothetical protein
LITNTPPYKKHVTPRLSTYSKRGGDVATSKGLGVFIIRQKGKVIAEVKEIQNLIQLSKLIHSRKTQNFKKTSIKGNTIENQSNPPTTKLESKHKAIFHSLQGSNLIKVAIP